MNAKQMFEELGYKLFQSDSKLCYKIKKFQIEFDLSFKEYTVFELDEEYPTLQEVISITVHEHKAIHQQLIELRWI